jgi:putative membrane protein
VRRSRTASPLGTVIEVRLGIKVMSGWDPGHSQPAGAPWAGDRNGNPGPGDPEEDMMYRGHDGVGPIFGLLFLLLLGVALAALVVGLLMLFRRSPGRLQPHAAGAGFHTGWHPSAQPPTHPVAAAEQTLAERLARGEIDVADYEQRLAALRRSQPPAPMSQPPAAQPGPPPPPPAG